MKVKLMLKGGSRVTYEDAQVIRVTTENTTGTCDAFLTDASFTICTRDSERIEWEVRHMKRRREKKDASTVQVER